MQTALAITESILHTFESVRGYLPTLSPSQYNYYKSPNIPLAQTIMRKTGKSWQQLLDFLALPLPLDRDTLAKLSGALHILEKQIVATFGLGWDEKTFTITNHRKMRPDSCNVERMYLQNSQILVLDVKLSITSSPIAIYKYLPIFENPPVPCQMTFFPDWLSPTDEAELYVDTNGQHNLFLTNNVLYICYLIGKPHRDILPGREVSAGRVALKKKKRLPANLEIRFIEFSGLAEVYCQMAAIEYDRELIEPILAIAQKIKEVVLTLPEDAAIISEDIYSSVKNGKNNVNHPIYT